MMTAMYLSGNDAMTVTVARLEIITMK